MLLCDIQLAMCLELVFVISTDSLEWSQTVSINRTLIPITYLQCMFTGTISCCKRYLYEEYLILQIAISILYRIYSQNYFFLKVNCKFSPSISLSVSLSVSQSVSQSISQSVSQSICQSVRHPASQSLIQSVSQSVVQSVKLSQSPSLSACL